MKNSHFKKLAALFVSLIFTSQSAFAISMPVVTDRNPQPEVGVNQAAAPVQNPQTVPSGSIEAPSPIAAPDASRSRVSLMGPPPVTLVSKPHRKAEDTNDPKVSYNVENGQFVLYVHKGPKQYERRAVTLGSEKITSNNHLVSVVVSEDGKQIIVATALSVYSVILEPSKTTMQKVVTLNAKIQGAVKSVQFQGSDILVQTYRGQTLKYDRVTLKESVLAVHRIEVKEPIQTKLFKDGSYEVVYQNKTYLSGPDGAVHFEDGGIWKFNFDLIETSPAYGQVISLDIGPNLFMVSSSNKIYRSSKVFFESAPGGTYVVARYISGKYWENGTIYREQEWDFNREYFMDTDGWNGQNLWRYESVYEYQDTSAVKRDVVVKTYGVYHELELMEQKSIGVLKNEGDDYLYFNYYPGDCNRESCVMSHRLFQVGQADLGFDQLLQAVHAPDTLGALQAALKDDKLIDVAANAVIVASDGTRFTLTDSEKASVLAFQIEGGYLRGGYTTVTDAQGKTTLTLDLNGPKKVYDVTIDDKGKVSLVIIPQFSSQRVGIKTDLADFLDVTLNPDGTYIIQNGWNIYRSDSSGRILLGNGYLYVSFDKDAASSGYGTIKAFQLYQKNHKDMAWVEKDAVTGEYKITRLVTASLDDTVLLDENYKAGYAIYQGGIKGFSNRVEFVTRGSLMDQPRPFYMRVGEAGDVYIMNDKPMDLTHHPFARLNYDVTGRIVSMEHCDEQEQCFGLLIQDGADIQLSDILSLKDRTTKALKLLLKGDKLVLAAGTILVDGQEYAWTISERTLGKLIFQGPTTTAEVQIDAQEKMTVQLPGGKIYSVQINDQGVVSLTLRPDYVHQPFSVTVFSTESLNGDTVPPSLQIEVVQDKSAKITIRDPFGTSGSVYAYNYPFEFKGVFDPETFTVRAEGILRTPYEGSQGLENWEIKMTQTGSNAFRVNEVIIHRVELPNRVLTVRVQYSPEGCMIRKSVVRQVNTQTDEVVYQYLVQYLSDRSSIIVRNQTDILSNGILRQRILEAYDSSLRHLGQLSVSAHDGRFWGSYSELTLDAKLGLRKEVTLNVNLTVSEEQGQALMNQLNSWDNRTILDPYATHRDGYYLGWGLYFTETKDAQGHWKVKAYWQPTPSGSGYRAYIVVGEPDYYGSENDDIYVAAQEVMGYSIRYSETAIIFIRNNQVIGSVDYPNQKQVVLDGTTYNITVNEEGVVNLSRS